VCSGSGNTSLGAAGSRDSACPQIVNGAVHVGTGFILLEFKYQALQHICSRIPGLFGQHAGMMVQTMWQAARFVTNSLEAYHIPDPERGQASDQP